MKYTLFSYYILVKKEKKTKQNKAEKYKQQTQTIFTLK